VAYALQDNETVPAAIARIMNEQIVRVREQLTDAGAPIDKRVHDARKRFKETRALVRVIRDPLGAQFAVENAWFRDAGRDLSAARDADAVIEALLKLKLPRHIRSRAKRALEARRPHDAADLERRIANVLDQLVIAQARIGMWPTLRDSFETIASGLRRTYRDGRRAMRNAMANSGMPHELHEWRKRVKEHWYHVQLLRNVWPPMMKAYASVLEDLSHTLGDHHDLFELRQIVARAPREFGRPASALALLDAIDARQRELEAQATDIGRRVYAERSRTWLARMRNEWNAWQA
jgi:CHAD domain-containing protein